MPGANDEDEEFRQRAAGCLDGLYNFAVSLCRDRSRAEDLVQEAYLRAFRAAHHPLPDENTRSWLFTILHNVWRNECRRRAAESIDSDPSLVRLLPVSPSTVDRDLDQAAAETRLRAAINSLPEAYRETVVLRFSEGFSYQEIATILECPAGTVMSRLGRARSLLRRAMTASGPRRVVGGRS